MSNKADVYIREVLEGLVFVYRKENPQSYHKEATDIKAKGRYRSKKRQVASVYITHARKPYFQQLLHWGLLELERGIWGYYVYKLASTLRRQRIN